MYSTQEVSRPELTSFLEQAQAAEKFFIGQKILPVHGVPKRAGRFPVIKIAKGNLLRRDNTKRNSSGTYNEITRMHEWDNYDLIDRGLEERIDDTKKEEMKDFFSLERLKTKLVGRACRIDFEANAAEVVMNEGNFPKIDAAADYTEANIDTIDVPQDFNAAIEALTTRSVELNTMVLSLQVWNRIRRSTMLQGYLYGKLGQDVNKRLITPKDLENAFGIDTGLTIKVYVAAASYDASNRGKTTPTLVPIWGNTHIFFGCVKGGDFDAGGVGRTLSWDADVSNGLWATETYRDAKRRSDMVRVRSNSAEKIIDESAGQLLKLNWA